MKLSQFFTLPGIRAFSVRTGIIVGIAVCIFSNWRFGVLIGAVVTLLSSLILPFVFYIKLLPYAKLKKNFPQPFLFDEPVRFTVKKGTVGGFFILTEKSMIFLSKECSNSTVELTRDKVRAVSLGKNFTIEIQIGNTQFIRVFSGACEELIEILRTNGWNVTQ